MTHNAVNLQPAFILQHQPYRETSLLLDVLTRDEGRLPLVAKGVRKPQSKMVALLQPFVPLNISAVGKAELKGLSHAEAILPALPLQGLALYCGFYVNELVGRFLHPHDPHPEVFYAYRQCLAQLAENTNIQTSLRIFELELLDHTGYGLDFGHDADTLQAIDPQQTYRFKMGAGLLADKKGQISGATLQALAVRDFESPKVQIEAKLLMRTVIDAYLQSKPLKSRAVIQQIVNSDVYG